MRVGASPGHSVTESEKSPRVAGPFAIYSHYGVAPCRLARQEPEIGYKLTRRERNESGNQETRKGGGQTIPDFLSSI
jgi:hypothetical protein